MGWIANALMLLGAYFIARKWKWGFVCLGLGNLLWGIVAVRRDGQVDLLAVSVAFVLMDVYGFINWKRSDRSSH